MADQQPAQPVDARGPNNLDPAFFACANEYLDSLGQERNIDVGISELAAEYAAAGVQVGKQAATPAGDYVAAAASVPPAHE